MGHLNDSGHQNPKAAVRGKKRKQCRMPKGQPRGGLRACSATSQRHAPRRGHWGHTQAEAIRHILVLFHTSPGLSSRKTNQNRTKQNKAKQKAKRKQKAKIINQSKNKNKTKTKPKPKPNQSKNQTKQKVESKWLAVTRQQLVVGPHNLPGNCQQVELERQRLAGHRRPRGVRRVSAAARNAVEGG